MSHFVIECGHPQIKEIIQKAHDLGFWVNILTNGLSINDEMAKFLSTFWRLQVRVSLEGADKEIHEYFRGKNTFAPMIRNIDRMNSYGVRVNLGLTIYEENRDQVLKVARLCMEKGCLSLRVVPVIRINNGKEALTSRDLYEGILKDVISATLELKDYVQFSNTSTLPNLPVSTITTKPCFAGQGFLGVGVDGTLMPCSLIRFGEKVPLIKYHEPADIDRLSFGMSEYFTYIEKNQKGLCADCEFLKQCRGGCPGEKLSFGLDPIDEQPICMKSLLENVIGDFKPDEVKPIFDSWINDMNNGIENLGEGYCMRQAPFWKISFKRKKNKYEQNH